MPRLPPKTLSMQHSCSHSNAIMQPEILEPHRTMHTGTPTRCKTHRTNNETNSAAPAAQTRYLSSPHADTLHGNTRFHAPASSPKQSPYNIHAAIPMRSCNQRFKNRIELRTQEQPLLGKRIGGTIRARNDPSRTRRTEEVPFIAGCSHFRRKHKVSCSGFLET